MKNRICQVEYGLHKGLLLATFFIMENLEATKMPKLYKNSIFTAVKIMLKSRPIKSMRM
jgi:hypothetical protein